MMSDQPSSPASLPCPFCGMVPEVTPYGVCCQTDGCPAESGGFGTVKNWNRRAGRPMNRFLGTLWALLRLTLAVAIVVGTAVMVLVLGSLL